MKYILFRSEFLIELLLTDFSIVFDTEVIFWG